MQNIKKRMEKNPVTESHQDPGDGTVSLSATVFDGYTGEKLLHLDWYCKLLWVKPQSFEGQSPCWPAYESARPSPLRSGLTFYAANGFLTAT